MEIEDRFLPKKRMLDVPLYARQTAQSALRSLQHRYPETLSHGEEARIEEVLTMNL